MEFKLKPFLGKYKAKDVDAYLISLNSAHKKEISQLREKIDVLEKTVADLDSLVKKYKEKEGVIAKVMLDATQHAKEIEDDYRKRANESDEACRKLHEEWVSGMQSAAVNLAKMRSDAKEMLDAIDGQFASLCSWADNKLDSLEKAVLPDGIADRTLEREIADGANADLGELCREMGMFDGSENGGSLGEEEKE